MTGCAACRPPQPVIPDTAADQAEYMRLLRNHLRQPDNDLPPAAVLADICHAIWIIGQAVTRADAAYAAGLAHRKAAAAAARKMEQGQ